VTSDGSGNFSLFLDQFGTGNSPRAILDGLLIEAEAPIIPEPAGLGLIGLALLAVRKRRS